MRAGILIDEANDLIREIRCAGFVARGSGRLVRADNQSPLAEGIQRRHPIQTQPPPQNPEEEYPDAGRNAPSAESRRQRQIEQCSEDEICAHRLQS